jgi:hypothetical protein
MTGIIMSVTTRSGAGSRTARGAAVPGLAHLVPGPLEDRAQHEPLARLIIDDQDPLHRDPPPPL